MSEEDVANPLHMEVRREVFDTVVRTRDLHTDRELKYWSNAYCRIYGTKENDVFFPENKKNLGNSQSSAVLYVNISNPECNTKYTSIFYMPPASPRENYEIYFTNISIKF